MKVMVTIQIGDKETTLVGNAVIFDSHINRWLGDIGFWLTDWHYASSQGPKSEGPVFVTWANCPTVVNITGKEDKDERTTG